QRTDLHDPERVRERETATPRVRRHTRAVFPRSLRPPPARRNHARALLEDAVEPSGRAVLELLLVPAGRGSGDALLTRAACAAPHPFSAPPFRQLSAGGNGGHAPRARGRVRL